MKTTFTQDQRGNVAVELALVLPLLMLFLAGIVEFGLAYWEQQILSAAAREGARAATRRLEEYDDDRYITTNNVKTLVKNYIEEGGMSSSGLNVTVSTASIPGQTAKMKIVTVTRPHTFSLFPAFFSPAVTLTGKATMAMETS